jgi:hypothetical protein
MTSGLPSRDEGRRLSPGGEIKEKPTGVGGHLCSRNRGRRNRVASPPFHFPTRPYRPLSSDSTD